jgi:hypothetical protein
MNNAYNGHAPRAARGIQDQNLEGTMFNKRLLLAAPALIVLAPLLGIGPSFHPDSTLK